MCGPSLNCTKRTTTHVLFKLNFSCLSDSAIRYIYVWFRQKNVIRCPFLTIQRHVFNTMRDCTTNSKRTTLNIIVCDDMYRRKYISIYYILVTFLLCLLFFHALHNQPWSVVFFFIFLVRFELNDVTSMVSCEISLSHRMSILVILDNERDRIDFIGPTIRIWSNECDFVTDLSMTSYRCEKQRAQKNQLNQLRRENNNQCLCWKNKEMRFFLHRYLNFNQWQFCYTFIECFELKIKNQYKIQE